MPIDVFWFIAIALAVHIGGWISVLNDKPFKFRKLFNSDYNLIKQRIETMNWREFELFCGKLFSWMGYDVEVTECENDYGRDIILSKEIFVECKHYHKNGSKIGREIISKLIGSCAMFNIHKAIIITTGQYHENAFEYQEKLNKIGEFHLELYDMSDIMKMVRKVGTSEVLRELGFPIRYWDENALKERIKS